MKRAWVWLVLCLIGLNAVAQDDNGGVTPKIDSVMAISPDYMPVSEARLSGSYFMPLQYEVTDTSILHVSDYDPLLKNGTLYQSLGIHSQAHQSIVFDYKRDIDFLMCTLPFPLYYKTQKDLKFYDLETSYTNIAYNYGTTTELTAEHTFSATHVQKFKELEFAGNLSGYRNKGYFMRQETNRMSFDVLLHYHTPNNIYGFNATYIFNRSKNQENGGLSDYRAFSERTRHDSNTVSSLGSFSVLFKNASSYILSHDMLFLQYVNLRDRHNHYYGTVTHTLEYKAVKSTFNDYNLNNDFYQNRYYQSTDTTRDTLRYYTLANTLQWSNFEPLARQSDRNYFIRIAGGVRHEYVNAYMPKYASNNLSIFARTHIRLFRVWDIYGSIAYSFLNYTKNNAIANVGATFALKREWKHYLGFSAHFYRVSPEFIFSLYSGNNNTWEKNWPKENNLKLSAYYTIFGYKLSFNYFMLNNYVHLNEQYIPVMIDKSVSILQLNLDAPVRTSNFKADINLSLQHSTRPEISVPLFAGKVYAAYCFRVFRNKLKIMVGANLMYNTYYYADGYNPLMHQFYHQETVKVGNYLYFDANVTLQVRRLAFFFRAGNIIAGAFGYNYFTTPYYPMQGQNFEVGLTWKFYD